MTQKPKETPQSTCGGPENLLKSRVSEIRVKQIRINQGVGVQQNFGLFFLSYCYSKKL